MFNFTMIGEKGMELIKETARNRDGNMGPFNEDKVRLVLEEMGSLFESNQRELENSHAFSPAVHMRHAAIERNKRCLLAYIAHRADRVQDMRWNFGAVLPPAVKAELCEPEVTFFNRYGRDLANYMRSVGDGAGLDLMSDLHPPKSLYVEVRCVQDYGELETDSGDVIVLKKNTQHFLPRSLCEPLIRQGVLKHVTDN